MKSSMNVPGKLPSKLFKDKKEWVAWLDKNQATSLGLWLRIAKKKQRTSSR